MNNKTIEELVAEFDERFKVYLTIGGEGQSSLEMDIKDFLLNAYNLGIQKAVDVVVERFDKIPASVQCRVATDCKYCQRRTDVSYHDALSDLTSQLTNLIKK